MPRRQIPGWNEEIIHLLVDPGTLSGRRILDADARGDPVRERIGHHRGDLEVEVDRLNCSVTRKRKSRYLIWEEKESSEVLED
jgi:hypothetical protein